MGLLSAILDAIHGSDDQIGGQAVTRLTAPLAEDGLTTIAVEATDGFGYQTEGGVDARLLIGGEIIDAATRTTTSFDTLTRGVNASIAKLHPVGTLVYDLSANTSAIDLVRRGIFVNTAIGEDLDIIARNLGLPKCPGMTEAQWRAVVKATAYLAKQPMQAFRDALDALLGVGNYTVTERITDPWTVFVSIALVLATSLRGRFVLNGGEEAQANGAGTTVTVANDVVHVIGVYEADWRTRAGERDFATPITNYYTGGSFIGAVITLGTPCAPNLDVIVDYGSFTGHYLPTNEALRDDDTDIYPYLADPFLTVRCLLNRIRAAGIKVQLDVV